MKLKRKYALPCLRYGLFDDSNRLRHVASSYRMALDGFMPGKATTEEDLFRANWEIRRVTGTPTITFEALPADVEEPERRKERAFSRAAFRVPLKA